MVYMYMRVMIKEFAAGHRRRRYLVVSGEAKVHVELESSVTLCSFVAYLLSRVSCSCVKFAVISCCAKHRRVMSLVAYGDSGSESEGSDNEISGGAAPLQDSQGSKLLSSLPAAKFGVGMGLPPVKGKARISLPTAPDVSRSETFIGSL